MGGHFFKSRQIGEEWARTHFMTDRPAPAAPPTVTSPLLAPNFGHGAISLTGPGSPHVTARATPSIAPPSLTAPVVPASPRPSLGPIQIPIAPYTPTRRTSSEIEAHAEAASLLRPWITEPLTDEVHGVLTAACNTFRGVLARLQPPAPRERAPGLPEASEEDLPIVPLQSTEAVEHEGIVPQTQQEAVQEASRALDAMSRVSVRRRARRAATRFRA